MPLHAIAGPPGGEAEQRDSSVSWDSSVSVHFFGAFGPGRSREQSLADPAPNPELDSEQLPDGGRVQGCELGILKNRPKVGTDRFVTDPEARVSLLDYLHAPRTACQVSTIDHPMRSGAFRTTVMPSRAQSRPAAKDRRTSGINMTIRHVEAIAGI